MFHAVFQGEKSFQLLVWSRTFGFAQTEHWLKTKDFAGLVFVDMNYCANMTQIFTSSSKWKRYTSFWGTGIVWRVYYLMSVFLHLTMQWWGSYLLSKKVAVLSLMKKKIVAICIHDGIVFKIFKICFCYFGACTFFERFVCKISHFKLKQVKTIHSLSERTDWLWRRVR